MRARWTTSIDVRTQTEYGTLRAYTRAGFQTTTGETTQGRIYTERGFIQFAGFTFGKSQSYFDFFGGAFCYGCSYTGAASMTGAAGTLLAAYTATFGNGFTATIALEDQFMRRNAIWDASNDATNALVIGNMPGPGYRAGLLQRRGGQPRRSARRPVSRTSSDRCALTRLGVRHRSPAPCTSSVLATTATTRPARARALAAGVAATWMSAGRRQCLPRSRRCIRLGRDGGCCHQPAVAEGRQVLR